MSRPVWGVRGRESRKQVLLWCGSPLGEQFFQWGVVSDTNEPRYDKTNNVAVRPVKTQISLGICLVWSESSLSAWRNLRSLATHWVHSEDSDQTGRMPRLIWVFTERTLILLVLSCRGSNEPDHNKTDKMICVHREDWSAWVSCQVRSVFIVCRRRFWVLGKPRMIKTSLGAQVTLLALSCSSSNNSEVQKQLEMGVLSVEQIRRVFGDN